VNYFLVGSSRRIEYYKRRKRCRDANQAIAGPDERRTVARTVLDVPAKGKPGRGEFRRVQVVGVDATMSSGEDEQAIGVGGETVAEVTMYELRG